MQLAVSSSSRDTISHARSGRPMATGSATAATSGAGARMIKIGRPNSTIPRQIAP